MKKLNILLCGASDIYHIKDFFDQVVGDFGCEPAHFFNSTTVHSNHADWKQNSMKSVQLADIIIYVIMDKYGGITWETEYVAALMNGKPYSIFCIEHVANSAHSGTGKIIQEDATDDLAKNIRIMDMLTTTQKSPISFTTGQFPNLLRRELSNYLFDGVKLLQQQNSTSNVMKFIEEGDWDKLHEVTPIELEKNYLKDALMDRKKGRNLRKGILEFYKIHKLLSDDELILLMNDSEQGVYRKVMEDLPKLISEASNLDKLFKGAIEVSQTNTDIGVVRRAIISILDIDALRAITHLMKLFPTHDIGVPKRILESVNGNFDTIKDDFLVPEKKESYINLAKKCLDFDPDSVTLNDLFRQFMEKVSASKS